MSRLNPFFFRKPEFSGKKRVFNRKSGWTLADCELHAAAPDCGVRRLRSLCLTRARNFLFPPLHGGPGHNWHRALAMGTWVNAQTKILLKKPFSSTARIHSGWLRVERGGSRAKTPPLAARPLWTRDSALVPVLKCHKRCTRGSSGSVWSRQWQTTIMLAVKMSVSEHTMQELSTERMRQCCNEALKHSENRPSSPIGKIYRNIAICQLFLCNLNIRPQDEMHQGPPIIRERKGRGGNHPRPFLWQISRDHVLGCGWFWATTEPSPRSLLWWPLWAYEFLSRRKLEPHARKKWDNEDSWARESSTGCRCSTFARQLGPSQILRCMCTADPFH